MSKWTIKGPYEDGRFCLVEIKDDGEQYARGMFSSRAAALRKARGER